MQLVQANLNYYKFNVTLTVKTLRWADGMLKEQKNKTFMASYWNINFVVRVERVKGFHYRSLWFKNTAKSKRNQVRESMKEYTNKK